MPLPFLTHGPRDCENLTHILPGSPTEVPPAITALQRVWMVARGQHEGNGKKIKCSSRCSLSLGSLFFPLFYQVKFYLAFKFQMKPHLLREDFPHFFHVCLQCKPKLMSCSSIDHKCLTYTSE